MKAAETIVHRHTFRAAVAAGALLVVLASRTGAVIFYETADTNRNTSPPEGVLTNSGWQWQGRFGSFLGTPVAPHHFLTAAHIGGSTNWPFYYAGTTYTATASYTDPGSDLRLWRVRERFHSYAPLYTNDNEVGQSVVVFGRGRTRGAEVLVGSASKGWQWGGLDGALRWGENTVVPYAVSGMLKADFNRTGGTTNETHLAVFDSAGAVFIQDAGAWRLAGINYAVDGPFSTDGTDSNSFNAALFDKGGLYEQSGSNWVFVSDRPQDKPSAFYASRVSQRFEWITNTIPADEFDVDADGLPDTWELRFGTDRTSMAPTDNPDGDPYDNIAEFTADTDPTNAASYPRILGFSAKAGTAAVTYVSSTARWYLAESLTGRLADASWSPLGEAVPGSAATGTWYLAVQPGPIATGIFIRVRSLLP